MKKLLVTIAALGLTATAFAEDPAVPNRGVDKVAGEGGVSEVAIAHALADWGRENESPAALLAAAEILAAQPAEEATMEKGEEAGEGEAEEKADEPAPVLVPEDLVTEAMDTAKGLGQKYLVKHLSKVTLSTRGASGGPKYVVERVNSHSTDYYMVEFQGGSGAEIALSGDGDTDLDLFVYDENGNRIASDTGATDDAYVSWTPRWTGQFRIEVKNLGGVYNQYVMITN